MENIIKIKGYHTCKIDGGWSYILANAPFLSEKNDRQWLTNGYYFWTDSNHFAHKWGEKSIKSGYAIIKCLIEMERDSLLDLVGSVEDQLRFQEILKLFKKRLKKIDPEQKITVNAIISFCREEAKSNKAIFPYSGIKAQDGLTFQGTSIHFVKTRNEWLPSLTRQQFCLFDFAVDCIKDKEIIYPEQLKESYQRYVAEKQQRRIEL